MGKLLPWEIPGSLSSPAHSELSWVTADFPGMAVKGLSRQEGGGGEGLALRGATQTAFQNNRKERQGWVGEWQPRTQAAGALWAGILQP